MAAFASQLPNHHLIDKSRRIWAVRVTFISTLHITPYGTLRLFLRPGFEWTLTSQSHRYSGCRPVDRHDVNPDKKILLFHSSAYMLDVFQEFRDGGCNGHSALSQNQFNSQVKIRGFFIARGHVPPM
jgi:hypothetical protein